MPRAKNSRKALSKVIAILGMAGSLSFTALAKDVDVQWAQGSKSLSGVYPQFGSLRGLHADWPSKQPHQLCETAAEGLRASYLVSDKKKSATLDPTMQKAVDSRLMKAYERCYRYFIGCLQRCPAGGFQQEYFEKIMADLAKAHKDAAIRTEDPARLHAGLSEQALEGICMSCGKKLEMRFDGRWRAGEEHHWMCSALGGDHYERHRGVGAETRAAAGPVV